MGSGFCGVGGLADDGKRFYALDVSSHRMIYDLNRGGGVEDGLVRIARWPRALPRPWRMTGSAPSDGRSVSVAERYKWDGGGPGEEGDGRDREGSETWRMTGSAPSDGRWVSIAERLEPSAG